MEKIIINNIIKDIKESLDNSKLNIFIESDAKHSIYLDKNKLYKIIQKIFISITRNLNSVDINIFLYKLIDEIIIKIKVININTKYLHLDSLFEEYYHFDYNHKKLYSINELLKDINRELKIISTEKNTEIILILKEKI